jgi:hypothetical protein
MPLREVEIKKRNRRLLSLVTMREMAKRSGAKKWGISGASNSHFFAPDFFALIVFRYG